MDKKTMSRNIYGPLLEGIILSTIKEQKDGTYGYEISKKIQKGTVIHESSIYQTLHVLCKEKYINYSSMVVNGRNRKIYKINEAGLERLYLIKKEWDIFLKWVSVFL